MLVYLASPYTHADPAVRLRRFEQACKHAAAMMRDGAVVFSPIAHSHSIDIIGGPLPQTTEFWMAQDLPILRKCDRLVVLMLDGWQTSKGVAREVEAAEAVGIPIEFAAPHQPQEQAQQEATFVDDE